MKKTGFTLIELLAVIVILAIIALIITPIISNVIDASRKAAFKESVNGIIDSGGSYLQEYILKYNNELNDFPVEFPCDGTKCGNGEFTLTFKGNVPKSGNIIIQRDGILAEYITDGKYCAYGYKWNLVVENSCGDVDVTKPTITGTQNGKVITLTMTDNESGIDSYCATNTDSTEGCNWVVPSNASSEEYEIAAAGTKYFFTKDKKGNISDSINFTTTSGYYCQLPSNYVVQSFSYTGNIQTFSVPSGCTGLYQLEVWGAKGGDARPLNQTVSGGNGGYAKGEVTLIEDSTIYVVVGGAGVTSNAGNRNVNGGYNGGGSASCETPTGLYKGGGSGGGATHIGTQNALLASSSADSIYIVAGGGAGAYAQTTYPSGPEPEYISTRNSGASGGVNTSPVGTTMSPNGGTHGSPGHGGAGGGYVGGAGNSGGTNYFAASLSSTVSASGSNSMPNPSGGTMTGNSGNGYARITYLGY